MLGKRLGRGFLKLEVAWLDAIGRGSSRGLLRTGIHCGMELVLITHTDLSGLLPYFGRALLTRHEILEQ